MDKFNLADESVNNESARPFRCTVYGEVNLKIRVHLVTLGESIYLKQM